MANRIPITFTAKEKAKIEKLAAKARLSFSNYVRQALGLKPLTQGGPQPRTDLYCGVCWRDGKKKVEVFKDRLCAECWHRDADAKSAVG